MEFCVLGPLEVRIEGAPQRLKGIKQRALLTILLLHANEVVSSDRLIDELWGARPPETAANTLQVYVSQVRQTLGRDVLLTRPPGYVLRVEAGELDVHRFERLVAEADGTPPEVAAPMLREALALWRGPALGEFAFEAFAQGEIARLEDLRLAATEDRLEADLALGRHAELVGELESLIQQHPFRERFRAQLMLALYRSGRQAVALKAYQDTRSVFVEELGIESGPSLQRLEKAILVQDAELDLAAPAAPAPAREEQRAPAPVFKPAREIRRVEAKARHAASASRGGSSRAATLSIGAVP